MEGLVAIGFGRSDEVLETSHHRRVNGMHDAQHCVAFLDGPDDDAQSHQIVDLIEADASPSHLLVNAEEVFRSPRDADVDAGSRDRILDRFPHFLDEGLTLLPLEQDLVSDAGVGLRFDPLEAEILHFPTKPSDPESVGEGRVDIATLDGHSLLGFSVELVEVAEVVQSVGEFDEDDAQIFGKREQDRAEVFGPGLLRRVEDVVLDLSDAFDEGCDFLSEFLSQGGEGSGLFVDGFVKETGGDRCRTDVDVDENFRDRESVLDQGFARPPDLGTVGSFCKVIGVGQKDKVVRGPHVERGFEQVVKERVPGSALESLLVRGGLLRGS